MMFTNWHCSPSLCKQVSLLFISMAVSIKSGLLLRMDNPYRPTNNTVLLRLLLADYGKCCNRTPQCSPSPLVITFEKTKHHLVEISFSSSVFLKSLSPIFPIQLQLKKTILNTKMGECIINLHNKNNNGHFKEQVI